MSDIIPEGILYGNLAVGSGTTNYNDLDNKPQINSVTLQGNKTASELGLVGTSDIPVTSVNGETGAVVLDGTEIEFSTGVSINEKILAVEQEIPVIAYPVTSVNGETGAVVLDGTEINYQAGKTINQKIDEVEAEIPVVSYPVTSVNGETGAVVLDGTDIEYSSGVSVNSQIDTLMDYIPVYGNTASGAIATFDTSLALPLQDCTIAINAVQESGTPTPSSPKAISGFTGANITRCGKNFFNIDNVDSGYSVTDTQFTINGAGYYKDFYQQTNGSSAPVNLSIIDKLPFLKAGTYTISYSQGDEVSIYAVNETDGSVTSIVWITSGGTFTLTKDSRITIRRVTNTSVIYKNFQIEVGSSAYEAYNGKTYPISWQSDAGTVYGGSLDVTSGKLTVTWGSIDLGSLTWTKGTSSGVTFFSTSLTTKTNANGLCSIYTVIPNTSISTADDFTIQCRGTTLIVKDSRYTDANDLTTALNGIYLAYELDTPVTYQLTPTQISAIVGTNNVFTDTNGNTNVVYACSLKDYIDSQ